MVILYRVGVARDMDMTVNRTYLKLCRTLWRSPIVPKARYMSHSLIRNEKRFVFVRHGLTEMNERLQSMPWYSKNFVDGALWDSRLSETGVKQARSRHQQLVHGQWEDLKLSDVEVVLASPLTRALHTAQLVFFGEQNLLPGVPKVAHPLLRERVYLSSEIGRCSSELQKEYPDWNFSDMNPGHAWWYVHPECGKFPGMTLVSPESDENGAHGHQRTSQTSASGIVSVQPAVLPHIHIRSAERARQSGHAVHPPYIEWRPEGRYCCEGEPIDVFSARVIQLREYLLSRPERCLAVVTHWGILKALTGREFDNCEVRLLKGSELLTAPDVTDK